MGAAVVDGVVGGAPVIGAVVVVVVERGEVVVDRPEVVATSVDGAGDDWDARGLGSSFGPTRKAAMTAATDTTPTTHRIHLGVLYG